jgi:hypothetical protein
VKRSHDRLWYAAVGVAAVVLIVFVVLHGTGSRHGKNAIASETKTHAVTTANASKGTRTTGKTTKSTTSKATTTTRTTAKPKGVNAPARPKPTLAELRSETSVFLTNLYNISPGSTDETHRAYIVQESGPGTYEVSSGYLSRLSLGLDQKGTSTVSGLVNKLRHDDRLSIIGVPEPNRQQITSPNHDGVKVVQELVSVRATYPSGKVYGALSQTVLTASAWRADGGHWALIAYQAAPLQLNSS